MILFLLLSHPTMFREELVENIIRNVSKSSFIIWLCTITLSLSVSSILGWMNGWMSVMVLICEKIWIMVVFSNSPTETSPTTPAEYKQTWISIQTQRVQLHFCYLKKKYILIIVISHITFIIYYYFSMCVY